MEKALTLKEVADLLSVSYGTVYAHRENLGFFQVGSMWRVWPDILRQRLAEPRPPKSSSPKAITGGKSYDLSLDYAGDQRAAREFAKLVEEKFSKREKAPQSKTSKSASATKASRELDKPLERGRKKLR